MSSPVPTYEECLQGEPLTHGVAERSMCVHQIPAERLAKMHRRISMMNTTRIIVLAVFSRELCLNLVDVEFRRILLSCPKHHDSIRAEHRDEFTSIHNQA